MGLFKTILKREQSADVVFDFKAKEFPLAPSPTAKEFISGQAFQSTDFQLNPLAAQQSGIAKLQKEALNDRVEEEALQQLKAVQEKAYKEAYDLGLGEGREQAFQEHREVIADKLAHFDSILKYIENMKSKLLADHETHFINMIFQIASRIAMREIKRDAESILPVVLQIVEDTQSQEQMTLRMAPEDLAFIEQARDKGGKTAEVLRRVRLEVSEHLTKGGCLLESNYGSIDATVEMRVARAWDTLNARLPNSEQRTPAASTKPDDTGGGDGSST